MERTLYALINLCCILTCSQIWLHLRRYAQNTERTLFQRRAIQSTLVFCMFDLLYALAGSFTFGQLQSVMYIINMGYFVSTASMAYCWTVYAGLLTNLPGIQSRRCRLLLMLPALLVVLLSCTSPLTHFIFHVDTAGGYHRGDLYILQPILSFGTVLAVCLRAFVQSFRKEYYLKRIRYRAVVGLVMYPMLGLIFTMIYPSLPTLCMGITTAALALQLHTLQEQVSLDPLTQLNNRRIMERHLSERMKAHREGTGTKRLYLFMMDADNFKHINDVYGHVEGDRALTLLADALRHSGAQFGGLVARYGGDEFTRICELASEEEARALCQSINEELTAIVQAHDLPYVIAVSIGYAEFTPDMTVPPDLIAQADRMLYTIKQERHKGRG